MRTGSGEDPTTTPKVATDDRVPLPNTSLRLLRAFLAVCDERNVGRAAARLYVSQPSLSQDIRRLERDVGFVLFVRGPKGMSLTPAGEEFARSVQTALQLIDRGVADARDLATGEQRTIAIAYTPSIGNRLMPDLLPALERRLAAYRIDDQEVDTGSVGPGVLRGQFDIGLAHHPGVHEGLASTALVREPLCVALASAHPLAQRDRLRLAELAELDLLIWPRATAPDYYDRVLELCNEAGLYPRAVREFRRALTRSYLLAAGQTFSLLPISTMNVRPPGVSFVVPSDAGLSVELHVVRRADDEREVLRKVEHTAYELSQALTDT